jgi:hypothetical protein
MSGKRLGKSNVFSHNFVWPGINMPKYNNTTIIPQWRNVGIMRFVQSFSHIGKSLGKLGKSDYSIVYLRWKKFGVI